MSKTDVQEDRCQEADVEPLKAPPPARQQYVIVNIRFTRELTPEMKIDVREFSELNAPLGWEASFRDMYTSHLKDG